MKSCSLRNYKQNKNEVMNFGGTQIQSLFYHTALVNISVNTYSHIVYTTGNLRLEAVFIYMVIYRFILYQFSITKF